jgi:hypothetical protein
VQHYNFYGDTTRCMYSEQVELRSQNLGRLAMANARV